MGRIALLLIALCCGPPLAGAADPIQESVLLVDGYQLRFVAAGEGQDVLVIGSALYYPRVFSSQLRRHLRLTFLDGRHFTSAQDESPRAPTMTLETFIEEIEAARVQLGLSRFILVGHSNHGPMAVAYALEYPEHVSHLVVIGSGPYRTPGAISPEAYWEQHASRARKAAYARAQARLADASREPLSDDLDFIRWYAHEGPRRWYDHDFDQLPLWEGIRMNWPVAMRYGEVLDGVLEEGVRQLRMPLLVVLGEHDYAVPPSNWNALAGLPHVTVRVFSRSGHNPMLEQPAKFDRTLLRWLARHPNPAGED